MNRNIAKSNSSSRIDGDGAIDQVMSIRQQRVAEMIKSTLIKLLNQGKIHDARLVSTNLTITSVKISPDLKVANCYVMPFASRISKEELMDAFEKSKVYLRMLVTKEVNLKFSPELRFFNDHGLDNVSQVDEILKNLASSK